MHHFFFFFFSLLRSINNYLPEISEPAGKKVVWMCVIPPDASRGASSLLSFLWIGWKGVVRSDWSENIETWRMDIEKNLHN